MEHYDFIVIGSGRASSFAIRVAKLGKKVAIIEKDKLGGVCPNKGCVPSKLLIGYANKIREIKSCKKHFIDAKIENIDVKKIFEEVNDYIEQVDFRYQERLKNVDIYRGCASFIQNHIINICDNFGKNISLSADKIIIDTGSRPMKPPFENALTSDDIFPFKREMPKSMVIVGGGAIACELGNFFSAVGTKVIQIVRGQGLLKNEDEEIIDIFTKEYSENIDVRFKTFIDEAVFCNNGFDIVMKNTDGIKDKLRVDVLLYAIGRESNADILKLENTDIKLDSRGYITRNKYFETDAKGVYVIGDASGKNMLQHTAAYEANHLAKVLLENENIPLEFKYIPHAIFSYPEIASVGLSAKKAEELGIKYISYTHNWLASAKAMSLKESFSRTKLLVDPHTYEILGAHLIGYESATMIHQILAVMNIDNDIRHLKEMLYIHPALNEALLSASVGIIKKIREYQG